MLCEDCKVGMEVIFGRPQGEKTRGVIEKLNIKKAKVKILENRGQDHNAGEVWGVPYGMMKPAKLQARTDMIDHIEYSPLQPAEDKLILEAISICYDELSPERLSCDGELSPIQVHQRRELLETKLRCLFKAYGQEVSDDAVCGWLKDRHKAMVGVDF